MRNALQFLVKPIVFILLYVPPFFITGEYPGSPLIILLVLAFLSVLMYQEIIKIPIKKTSFATLLYFASLWTLLLSLMGRSDYVDSIVEVFNLDRYGIDHPNLVGVVLAVISIMLSNVTGLILSKTYKDERNEEQREKDKKWEESKKANPKRFTSYFF